MGYSQNIYIGPYLKIEMPEKIKEVRTNRKYCSNSECSNSQQHVSGNFCPLCGNSLHNVIDIQSQTQKISHWDILSDFGDDDLMWVPEYLDGVFLPNSIKGPFENYFRQISSNSETGEMDIPNQEVATKAFEEEYKDFLDFLTTNSYIWQIKWGLVNSFS